MDSPKNQITDRLTKATNVLVTVSTSPSADQLAAAIGLTLVLNKLGKHATAVFSGEIPNTIEFLQPEKTLEKTTDSLRDFIIALDKSKADKLRYKVEDKMVKIFITPYRTSITDKDLEFSQGDFNVDVVMAVGVTESKDLDEAITSHGRILHDATVISVNTHDGANLGSINWISKTSSSLCEMLLELSLGLKEDVLDGQMSTAFLTGIVAETNRFSNEKTTSSTMQFSAKLIAAGANQQLVATQLQPPVPLVEKSETKPVVSSVKEEDAELPEVMPSQKVAPPAEMAEVAKKPDNGALQIDHGGNKPLIDINEVLNGEEPEPEEDQLDQIDIDNNGIIKTADEIDDMTQKVTEPLTRDESVANKSNSRLITQPPALGGTLTANSRSDIDDESMDLLGATQPQEPILSHDTKPFESPLATPISGVPAPTAQDIIGATPKNAFIPDNPVPPETMTSSQEDTLTENQADSLSDLEKIVDSPHLDQAPPTINPPKSTTTPDVDGIDVARGAVNDAVVGVTPQVVEPIQSLNARPMDLNLGDMPAVATSQESAFTSASNMVNPSLATPIAFPDPYIASNTNMPPSLVPQNPGLPADNTAGNVTDPTAPPPVPPPMIPPIMPPPTDTNTPS